MNKTPGTHWSSVGSEPDYRFTLANERTFLAWVRTALALFATGIVLDQLMQAGSHSKVIFGVSIAMVAASVLVILSAYMRWRSNQFAMRTNGRLEHGYSLVVLVIGFALASGVTLVCLIK